MKTIQIAIPLALVAFVATTAFGYVLNDLVDEAEAELKAELLAKLERSAASNDYVRKKATHESRAMAVRNKLFRKIKAKLAKAGEDNAVHVARMAIDDRALDKIKEYYPGGQSGKTKAVKMVDDMCKGTKVTCDTNSPYRMINGYCNNLQEGQEFWGAMGTKFRRDLAPVSFDFADIPNFLVPIPYQGGYLGRSNQDDENMTMIESDRQSGSCKKPFGRPLAIPTPRLVSTYLHKDSNQNEGKITHMVTQFGQFLDHDITLTPEHEEDECCNENPPADCMPIKIPFNDPFYTRIATPLKCLPFARSVLFCEEKQLVEREQINAITSFIDASNVYGSDDEFSRSLRSLEHGLLKQSETNLLPLIDGEYTAGDVRAREMPGLATMHTLWVREHNRLARAIHDARSDWDDETVFQEARRILIAEYQSIIYTEFLPTLLSEEVVNNPKSKLKITKWKTKYNPNVDPGVSNSFATAAYRFGHSMIQGLVQAINPKNGKMSAEYRLGPNFFEDANYEKEGGWGMENILKGLVVQPAAKFDPGCSDQVQNFLFQGRGSDHGDDLVARNIQRGRDHGLPGYIAFFKKFSEPNGQVDCWAQRPADISAEKWNLLEMLYKHPWDIDLFTGGLLEKPWGNSVIGKTFTRMLVDQFARLKDGDRFFFTHEGEAASFTNIQRKALTQRSFSDILCDNTAIVELQENVFKVVDPVDNKVSPCQGRKTLNINLFTRDRDPTPVNFNVQGNFVIKATGFKA